MGEAKRRGSYEKRKAEGEIRRGALKHQRDKEIAERKAAMTPEERDKERRTRMLLSMMGGIIMVDEQTYLRDKNAEIEQ